MSQTEVITFKIILRCRRRAVS